MLLSGRRAATEQAFGPLGGNRVPTVYSAKKSPTDSRVGVGVSWPCASIFGTHSRSAMSKSYSANGAWRRTTRQSGARSSATVPNWRSGCAVISSQPTSPGVSMRPTFVSRVSLEKRDRNQ